MIPYAKINSNWKRSYAPDCYAQFFAFKIRDTITGAITTFDKVTGQVSNPDLHLKPGPRAQPVAKTVDISIPGILHDGDVNAALETNVLPVAGDILSCSVTKTKERASGSWEMTLAPRKNYHALLHPGDHVLIWMNRSPNRTGDNSVKSGFKTWGVVTSVRVQRQTAANGAKTTRYVISGEDFGKFFETDIYFNPVMAENLKDQFATLYPTLDALVDFHSTPGENAHKLLNAFMGTLNRDRLTPIADATTPNKVFLMPGAITSFFKGNASTSGSINGFLQRHIGRATYVDGSTTPELSDLPGLQFIQVDTGNKFTTWSILKTYSNPTMNEMFVELRPDAAGDTLQPTIVIRQIPYTSTKAASELKGVPVTTFTSIPRFQVPESFIISEDIGRSDEMRCNYLQLFGNGIAQSGGADNIVFQTLMGNFAVDNLSVARHGVNAMLPQTSADIRWSGQLGAALEQGVTGDDPKALQKYFRFSGIGPASAHANDISYVPEWTQIQADWWLRAHLLETGTFHMHGIEEPIGIGDNLEIVRDDGSHELHHIQTYTHSYSVSPEGLKTFRTTVATVRGQTVDEQPLYTKNTSSLYPVSRGT